MTEAKVERRHREAALRIATDALADSNPLPARIGEWLENSTGSPIDVRADVWLGTLAEALAAAEAGGRQGAEWKRAPGELPDSDVVVVVATDDEDARDYSTARLEFTDDSDGRGEPYWALEGGDVAMRNYPNWKPVAPPSKPGGPT